MGYCFNGVSRRRGGQQMSATDRLCVLWSANAASRAAQHRPFDEAAATWGILLVRKPPTAFLWRVRQLLKQWPIAELETPSPTSQSDTYSLLLRQGRKPRAPSNAPSALQRSHCGLPGAERAHSELTCPAPNATRSYSKQSPTHIRNRGDDEVRSKP